MSLYRQTGSKIWWFDFHYQGQRIRESTGMSSKTRAREVENKRKQALRDGAAGIRRAQAPRLFFVAAEEFCERKAQAWSASMGTIAQTALKHLAPVFRSKLLCDITARDISGYQKQRLVEGAAPRSVNIEIGLMRGIMRRHDLWARVAKDVSMLKENDDCGHALDEAEEAALLSACARSRSRVLYPFIVTLLESGVRFNAVRTLQWRSVDLVGGSLKIGKDKTASGNSRAVPLSARATETLRFWSEKFPVRTPTDYVFPAEKYATAGAEDTFGFTPEVIVLTSDPSKAVGSIKTGWECARKRAGLPHFRIHDLRHTRASRLIVAGVPLPVIAKLLGWSAGTMARMAARYGHYSVEQMRSAIESASRPSPVPATAALSVETGKIQ